MGTGTGVGVGTEAAGGAAEGAGVGSKLSIRGAEARDASRVRCEPLRDAAFEARTECILAVGITAAAPPLGALATWVGAVLVAGGVVAGAGVVDAAVG